MPHFAVRAAAAALAFTLGLGLVWLSGPASALEAAFAEWLVPTPEVSVTACPMVGREEADSEVYETVLREMFGRRGADGWKIFYERLPNASGYVTLSAVGFNRDFDEAFLYAANECGRGLCGTGWHVLLRKNARGWEIESRRVVWQH